MMYDVRLKSRARKHAEGSGFARQQIRSTDVEGDDGGGEVEEIGRLDHRGAAAWASSA